MQNEFHAFIKDDVSREAATLWAIKQGFAETSVEAGDAENVLRYLSHEPAPRLLIVDSEGLGDAVSVMGHIVQMAGAACRVIVLGTTNDVNLYRAFVSVGAADYIVKPVVGEALSQAMAALLRGDAGGAKDAQILVVMGARGGVGASTLALSLCEILTREKKKNVALLDLDLTFGTSALALDVDPGHGLRDVVASAERVDGLMVASASVEVHERLTLLSAEESVEDINECDGNAVMALIKELRGKNDFVVVDLPRGLIAKQKRLLASAHEVLIVGELSLAGIRDTLRIKTTLKSLSAPARVSVVVARMGTGRVPQVDDTTFSKGIQARIDAALPDDAKAMADASNNGKSLLDVAPESALTEAVRDIAALYVADEEGTARKDGWLRSLFGNKKGEA